MRDYDLSLYREKRKLFTDKHTKDDNARKTEMERQMYLSMLEKQVQKDNTQLKHKPYQCDIELR